VSVADAPEYAETPRGGEMDDEKWLQRRYYGGSLPAEAERALHAVGLCWDNDVAAEAHILHALALAPDHLAVHYGAYKFYYYKHRLPDALPHVEAWVAEAIHRNKLPSDWREVTRAHADFTHFDDDPRLFLFALRAMGWLLARLGRLEDGRAALEKVADLDPNDQMRARRLLSILDEHDDEDEGVASSLANL
jgi:tetratricopeptide (TPR) repeat protein